MNRTAAALLLTVTALATGYAAAELTWAIHEALRPMLAVAGAATTLGALASTGFARALARRAPALADHPAIRRYAGPAYRTLARRPHHPRKA